MNIFERVPTAKVPRSGFNISETVKFTGNIGKMYPIYCRQMLPGDVFRIKLSSYVKFSPTNNPIFHEVYYKTRWFFVPHRLVDENFEDTITGGQDGLAQDKVFPRWNPSKSGKGLKTSVGDVIKPNSLWDYFGFPLLNSETGYNGSLDATSDFDDECMPLSYPLRSYNRIFNTWFRDEERQSEVVENETQSNYNSDCLYATYKNDYFTSAALSELKGIAPALPLEGTLPVLYSNTHSLIDGINTGFRGDPNWSGRDNLSIQGDDVRENEDGTRDITLKGANSAGLVVGRTDLTNYNQSLMNKLSDGYINLASAAGLSIPDIRLTSAIQRWMERNEECGSRYGEYLRSMYGVYPKDERLQRPEYIGGTSTLITASTVIQTSASEEGSPQGNETGRLQAFNNGYVGTYKAYEFGTLMCIAYVVPKGSYMCQGFPAEWMHLSRYEFPNPLFAHVGNIPVKLGELFAKGHKASGGNKGDDTPFGWQGKDDAYRVGKDRAIAGFRTATYQSWTMDRVFSDYPSNNSDFLSVNPDLSNVFAVPSVEHFASYTGFDIKAIRPLPKYPVPMLQ